MTPDRYQSRWRKVVEQIASRDIDALFVTSLPNIRYLTGFSGSAGVILVSATDVILFSDFRYQAQAEEEVGRLVRVEIVDRDIIGKVVSFAGGRRQWGRVGYESHVTPADGLERFERAGTPFTGVSGLIEDLRVQKDDDEVERIRRAAGLAHDALAAMLETVRPGEREIDVAARLEAELRVRGSEWHPFPTIVASGPRSALPHAGTSGRVIERGELLLIDYGATVDGYCSDITRTFVVGAPADERQTAVYDLVRDAQLAARQHVRGGMSGRDIDALARNVIDGRGFKDAFGHSLGHGLGLEVHERPGLSRVNEDPVPAGAVVTIEPGAYFAGWGGVRIEDDVLLTDSGGRLLSDGLTELRELR